MWFFKKRFFFNSKEIPASALSLAYCFSTNCPVINTASVQEIKSTLYFACHKCPKNFTMCFLPRKSVQRPEYSQNSFLSCRSTSFMSQHSYAHDYTLCCSQETVCREISSIELFDWFLWDFFNAVFYNFVKYEIHFHIRKSLSFAYFLGILINMIFKFLKIVVSMQHFILCLC